MAKEVRWSSRAIRERHEIEDYWTKRNKSNAYSLRLDQMFREGVNLLAEMPEFGKEAPFLSVRTIIIKDYVVYYRIGSNFIDILTIWDSRRNPKKFRL